MDPPPAYSDSQASASSNRRADRDPVPPYKASHRFASEEEELAALREFAHSKLYINPGADGSLPNTYNFWGPVVPRSGEPVFMTPEMKADKERQKAEKKAQKEEEKARRGSVGDRLKRVISGGNKS